jgi:hypothetical protein
MLVMRTRWPRTPLAPAAVSGITSSTPGLVAPARSWSTTTTPVDVTGHAVTRNAAGMDPPANSRFPTPNVIGWIFSQNAITRLAAAARSLA